MNDIKQILCTLAGYMQLSLKYTFKVVVNLDEDEYYKLIPRKLTVLRKKDDYELFTHELSRENYAELKYLLASYEAFKDFTNLYQVKHEIKTYDKQSAYDYDWFLRNLSQMIGVWKHWESFEYFATHFYSRGDYSGYKFWISDDKKYHYEVYGYGGLYSGKYWVENTVDERTYKILCTLVDLRKTCREIYREA